MPRPDRIVGPYFGQEIRGFTAYWIVIHQNLDGFVEYGPVRINEDPPLVVEAPCPSHATFCSVARSRRVLRKGFRSRNETNTLGQLGAQVVGSFDEMSRLKQTNGIARMVSMEEALEIVGETHMNSVFGILDIDMANWSRTRTMESEW